VKGHIQLRGPNTYRLKYDLDPHPITGERRTRYVTFHGTKRQAQDELARLMATERGQTAVDPNSITLAEFLASWAERAAMSVSLKTIERYRQLIDRQIVPHLGNVVLQKLKPPDITRWHATLLKAGRHDGAALSPQSVKHAHRVLHKALADAVDQELIIRNPATRVSPPKFDQAEIAILSADQVSRVLRALHGTEILPHIVVLISTGIRRGELMALQWGDIDFDERRLRVQRSIEATYAHGIRIKPPKTRHGRRRLTLPQIAVAALREHRAAQLEIRTKLGLGRLQNDHHVFGDLEGAPRHPDWITYKWKDTVKRLGLPKVTLHALRHSHASALIATGQDVVTVSRRLGHASPTITLSVYAHLFGQTDQAAASAIDELLKHAVASPTTIGGHDQD
jgi:integrase